jgi:hypothetical protein
LARSAIQRPSNYCLNYEKIVNSTKCEFCAALKKVRILVLGVFASTIAGMMLGTWLLPIYRDAGRLVACAGFAGSIILIWEFRIAAKRFEDPTHPRTSALTKEKTMTRTFGNSALLLIFSGMVGLAHADEYIVAHTVRVELPGLIQLVNKTTKCRAIAELKTYSSAGTGATNYEIVAKHEICDDSKRREIYLQGRLTPSVEGRVVAGTVIELTSPK